MPTTDQNKPLDFMAEARQRLKQGIDFEADDRNEARTDWRFFASEQWSEEDRARRQQDGRPCVTMNQIAPKVRQVMNQVRMHRPQAQVIATRDAEEADAEIVEGMLRNIQIGKYADLAHDWGAECALIGGFGSWRVVTDYCDDRSMHQEIRIEPILDPFAVIWDPNATKPDKSDAEWCFVTQSVTKEEFKRLYPGHEPVSGADFASLGYESTPWVSGDSIIIADYFRVVHSTRVLYQLPDGTTAFEDELESKGIKPGEDWPSREVKTREVEWRKINGIAVLEEYEWPGKYIPVITVEGQKIVIEGKAHLRGFVRDLREPQIGYNWMTSGVYEAIGAGTKAPWIAPEGMLEDHEQEWRNANRENRSVLQYKLLYGPDGSVIPIKPERNTAEPPIQAVSEARIQADQDFKGISGMFDPALGAAVTDQSGKAIQSLQQQANIGTFNFGDNLVFALEHEARIIVDLLPHYYDASRTISVEGRTRSKKKVQVFNSNIYTDQPPVPDPEAEAMLDLASGQYHVSVTVGPSFETQRQKDLEFWLRLAEADPVTMQIGRDIIYDLVDSPESHAMAERAKAVLPAPVQQAISGNQPDPSMLVAQNQQMSQMIQHMGRMLQELQQVIKSKQIEGASRIEVQKLKLLETQIKAASEEERATLKAKADIITHAADKHLEVVHDHAMSHRKESHEHAMADKQQRNQQLNAQQARAYDQALESQDTGV